MFEVPIKFKFFDKLKLYNDFISKSSIFQEKLWDECQSILVWSSSPKHKHIGTYLDTDIVCGIFGIQKDLFQDVTIDSDRTKDEKLKRLSYYPDDEDRKAHVSIIDSLPDGDVENQDLRNRLADYAIEKTQIRGYLSDEFIKNVTNKVIKDDLGNIEQAIKNLHAMGFGDLGDLGDFGNTIRINQKGFLMGELIFELNKNKCGKLRYLFAIWFMRAFVFLLVLYSLIFLIDYIVKFYYGYFI